MKVKYDRSVDVLYIRFNDEKVVESDEDKSGVILDYSDKQEVIGIEILNASKKMPSPSKIEYEDA